MLRRQRTIDIVPALAVPVLLAIAVACGPGATPTPAAETAEPAKPAAAAPAAATVPEAVPAASSAEPVAANQNPAPAIAGEKSFASIADLFRYAAIGSGGDIRLDPSKFDEQVSVRGYVYSDGRTVTERYRTIGPTKWSMKETDEVICYQNVPASWEVVGASRYLAVDDFAIMRGKLDAVGRRGDGVRYYIALRLCDLTPVRK
jgi:hypothetical protein